MFCPNCGANNSSEQNFCRACGLNLEKIALSLFDQLPSAESAELLRRERSLEKLGTVTFTGLGLLVLLGVGSAFYLIVTRLIFAGNVFAGIALMVFVVFAVLGVAYVYLNEDLKERKQKSKPGLKNELEKNLQTGKLLEDKPFQPASSVVENTTDLLHVEQKTRKLE